MNRKLGQLLLLLVAAGCEEVHSSGNEGSGSGSASASGSESASGMTTTPSETGDGEGSAESGADPDTEASCRETCDDLLLFSCLEADTHEVCYDACGTRSEDDIATFQACVENTLPSCAGCFENFIDADPPDPPETTGSAESSGGEAVTCVDACSEYVGAGCTLDFDVEFTSCDEFCGMLDGTLQELVVECVAERDGCTLPEYCAMNSSGGG